MTNSEGLAQEAERLTAWQLSQQEFLATVDKEGRQESDSIGEATSRRNAQKQQVSNLRTDLSHTWRKAYYAQQSCALPSHIFLPQESDLEPVQVPPSNQPANVLAPPRISASTTESSGAATPSVLTTAKSLAEIERLVNTRVPDITDSLVGNFAAYEAAALRLRILNHAQSVWRLGGQSMHMGLFLGLVNIGMLLAVGVALLILSASTWLAVLLTVIVAIGSYLLYFFRRQLSDILLSIGAIFVVLAGVIVAPVVAVGGLLTGILIELARAFLPRPTSNWTQKTLQYVPMLLGGLGLAMFSFWVTGILQFAWYGLPWLTWLNGLLYFAAGASLVHKNPDYAESPLLPSRYLNQLADDAPLQMALDIHRNSLLRFSSFAQVIDRLLGSTLGRFISEN